MFLNVILKRWKNKITVTFNAVGHRTCAGMLQLPRLIV